MFRLLSQGRGLLAPTRKGLRDAAAIASDAIARLRALTPSMMAKSRAALLSGLAAGRVRAPAMIAGARAILPGVLVSATIAMASVFISDHHGGPTLLYALLLGMAFHSVVAGTNSALGVNFCSKTVLRVGVALLGARIGLEQINALGWSPIVIVCCGVAVTIAIGIGLSRLLGLSTALGTLTGGSVAICGASAALAISAVLPDHKDKEREALFTVIAVTVLSTVAMILYPIFAAALGYGAQQAGLLFGATIHDVAQVVAAGHLVSDEAGLYATYTKLMRVAFLLPVVTLIALYTRTQAKGGRTQLIPTFLLVFAALIVLNSLGLVPKSVSAALSEVSRWCLIIAIAALGIKTSLGELKTVGWRPMALVVAETVYLLLLVIVLIGLLP
jgi:uncharacterized integral membrane protein (TIGR00698 family)